MPVFQKISLNDDQLIAVWKITESTDNLLSMAKAAELDLSAYPEAKIENRNKQWLATRLLVNHFESHAKISYDDFGKPLLSSGKNISISHAKHFVAIHLSAIKMNGIDIEEISSKVERIRHKFLGKNDYFINGNMEELTLCWSAKEAMFKYYGKGEVSFIDNLHLQKVNHSSQLMHGKINMQEYAEVVQLGWKKIDNFVLVYTM